MMNAQLLLARPLRRTLLRRWASFKAERGPYKQLTAQDIAAFREMLPATGVLSTVDQAQEADELVPFNQDWMSKYKGESSTVLRPKDAHQVSKILQYCYKNSIAIVPQGGNTGLVGGSVPVYDELVLSLSGMNQVRSFNDVSGILSVDGGCVLQVVDEYLRDRCHIMPLDLGAKGSCHIAGNVATNAGGLRLLRYGSLHGSVLGLEVVLPDEKGSILNLGMTGLRKDNTGYDLKQLFIGAEGTLGIITGVTILTPRRSSAINVALLSVSSFEGLQKVFVEAKAKLGEIISAFEFFDDEALNMVLHHSGAQRPIAKSEDGAKQFYALIETSGSNKDHDDEKLSTLLEGLMEGSLIKDGILAENETQLQTIWQMREGIAEAAGKTGKVYKYDLSLPLDVMYEVVEDVRERFRTKGMLGPDGDGSIKEVVGYGHLGDGNIHVNICAKAFEPRIEEVIEPWIYEWTSKHHGSISAEHGLGVMKAPYISYSQPDANVAIMQQLKTLFDPKGILNPYKYFLPQDAQKQDSANITSKGQRTGGARLEQEH